MSDKKQYNIGLNNGFTMKIEAIVWSSGDLI